MSITLSQKELLALTGYKRIPEQIRELNAQSIPYHLTPNRKLIVLRSNLDRPVSASEEFPNLDAI
jgi:hypothetical protein